MTHEVDDCAEVTIIGATKRYPFSLVWTPIPLLSWLIPMCGHIGICNSEGIIYDFAGSRTVNVGGRMAFGDPTITYRLKKPANASQNFSLQWDSGIEKATETFRNRNHYLIRSNCHSFVVEALKNCGYAGPFHTNPVCLLLAMFANKKYVGFKGYILTWAPFGITWLIIVAIVVFSVLK